MKREYRLLVFVLFLGCSSSAFAIQFNEDFSSGISDNFFLHGNAYWDTEQQDLVLTSNATWQLGALIFAQLVTPDYIKTSFDFTFQEPGGIGGGADGIVLLLAATDDIQNVATMVSSAGGSLGIAGVPGISVEVDTYHNPSLGDQENNHIAVNINGDMPRPVAYSADIPQLKSNGIFHIEIEITLSRVEVYLENISAEFPRQKVIEADITGFAPPTGFLALMASTGQGWELHRIDNLDLTISAPELPTNTPTAPPAHTPVPTPTEPPHPSESCVTILDNEFEVVSDFMSYGRAPLFPQGYAPLGTADGNMIVAFRESGQQNSAVSSISMVEIGGIERPILEIPNASPSNQILSLFFAGTNEFAVIVGPGAEESTAVSTYCITTIRGPFDSAEVKSFMNY